MDQSAIPALSFPTAEHAARPTLGPLIDGLGGLARIRREAAQILMFPGIAVACDLLAGLLVLSVMGYSSVGVLVLIAGMLALVMVGSYVDRLNLRILDALPRMMKAMGLAGTAVVVTLNLLGGTLLEAHAAAIVGMLLVWTALLLVGRRLSYPVIRKLRSVGRLGHRTLVVGELSASEKLVHLMNDYPEHGLRPVGRVGVSLTPGDAETAVPFVGPISDLPRLISGLDVSRVIVATDGMAVDDVLKAVRDCDRQDVEVYVEPGVAELLGARTNERIGPVALFRLSRRAHRTAQWRAKRVADCVLAFIALVLVSPILLVAGVLIRRETGAGLLFRQPRVGFDGRRFDVLKLQTMVPATSTESATQWNISQDSRLGPVGRFLRRTSIDELPQLLNVLRGEMSLVGPRPERPHFVEMFQQQYPRYVARHRVPSGLTGFAQVEGLRGDTSIAERVAFDNLYIEQWSLWLDAKIMLRTVPAVFRGEGG